MAITGRINAFPFDRTFLSYPPSSPAHVFGASLPGIGKEEVKVEVEKGNVPRIRGECAGGSEGMAAKWRCLKRGSWMFLRRFRLPENAKMDRIRGAVENPVLTVAVPKEEVKSVEVSC